MPEPDELDAALARALGRLDAGRAQALGQLEAVTRARHTGLERERGRLAKMLGDDHPRVLSLAARSEEGARRKAELKNEIARADAGSARPGASEWLLRGFVWSADLSPAAEMAVSLVDAQGQWLRAFGFVGTDDRGYFELRVPVPASPGPGAKPAGPPPTEAFVRVTDQSRSQVFRGTTPVVPVAGRVEYQEIVLAKEGPRGAVPPEEDAAEKPAPAPAPKSRRRT